MPNHEARFAFRRAHAFLPCAVSGKPKQQLQTLLTALREPDDARVVLFLGRLVSKKSPDLLLDAFSRWSGKPGNENSLLVMAGPARVTAFFLG